MRSNRRTGCPTLYDPDYHPRMVYRLALLNLSEREMCIPLEIDISLLEDWKRAHHDFRMAILAGRDQADAKVARALFRRAVGWGTLEYDTVSRKVRGPGGEHIEIKQVPRRKRYPPDVQAIALWLRNRQPNKWRTTEQNDQLAVPSVSINVDLSSLTVDELRLARKLAALQSRSSINPARAIDVRAENSGNNGHSDE